MQTGHVMLEILRSAHDLNILEARLVEWGRWIHYDSETVGWGNSPVYTLMRAQGVVGLPRTPLISDDEAEFIGCAIMQLRKAKPLLAEAVVNYYATRAKTNYQTLGRDLNVSRVRASELIQQALNWLQGYFCAGLQQVA